MEKFVNFIVKTIASSNPQFSELQLKKMEYGLNSIFGEITKLITFIIFFYLFSAEKYFLISFIFFSPIRLFSGGYHAKTYWGCFIFTLVFFVLIIFLGKYFHPNNAIPMLLIILSINLICIFSPVDNKNKPIKSKKRKLELNYLSICIVILESLLCYSIPGRYFNVSVFSIAGAVLLMMLGKIVRN